MRTKPPENETQAQRFTRMTELRTSNVIDALRLVGELGGEIPPETAELATSSVFGAIDAAAAAARAAWVARQKTAKPRLFTLAPADVNQATLPHTAPPAQNAAPRPQPQRK